MSATGHHLWERIIRKVLTVGTWDFDTLFLVPHRTHQWNFIIIHWQIDELSAINLTFEVFMSATGHLRQIHISSRDYFLTSRVRNIRFDSFQNWNRKFFKWQIILKMSLNEYSGCDYKEKGEIFVLILISTFENSKIIAEKPNLNEFSSFKKQNKKSSGLK